MNSYRREKYTNVVNVTSPPLRNAILKLIRELIRERNPANAMGVTYPYR